VNAGFTKVLEMRFAVKQIALRIICSHDASERRPGLDPGRQEKGARKPKILDTGLRRHDEHRCPSELEPGNEMTMRDLEMSRQESTFGCRQ